MLSTQISEASDAPRFIVTPKDVDVQDFEELVVDHTFEGQQVCSFVLDSLAALANESEM